MTPEWKAIMIKLLYTQNIKTQRNVVKKEEGLCKKRGNVCLENILAIVN